MKQTILTFITKVKPERVSDLKELLDGMAKDVEQNALIPFSDLIPLHFASLVLNDDPSYGAYLVFEHNFDGSLDPYLEYLYARASEGLHRIYSCCLDYPAANADKAQLLSYLRSHVVNPSAFHMGNIGRTVKRTHQEDVLRDSVEDFLDGVVSEGETGSPGSIRQRVQEFVRRRPMFAWTENVQPQHPAIEYFLPRLKLVMVAVLALALSPILIPLAIVWVIMLRWIETHDPPPADFADNAHVRDLVESEDRTHIVQNHMASITIVKPGAFRRLTLRGLLWLVNLIKRTSNVSELLGIPSIHFAHWSLLDKGRRLLFVSNYDGSWENYLDDFVDKASPGLTAIWSNTLDFPKTSFLFGEGARDGPRFKAWARAHQIETNVWYSAYPQLTVQTINNNSAICEALYTSLDDAGTSDWLRRF